MAKEQGPRRAPRIRTGRDFNRPVKGPRARPHRNFAQKRDIPSFGRKLPKTVPGGLRLGPFGLALGAVAVADYYLGGSNAKKLPLPGFANPAEWLHKHGRNTYSPVDYEPSPSRQGHTAYIVPSQSGPETGKITNQALPERYFLGEPVPEDENRVSYWYRRITGTAARFAQADAWMKVETEVPYENQPEPSWLNQHGPSTFVIPVRDPNAQRWSRTPGVVNDPAGFQPAPGAVPLEQPSPQKWPHEFAPKNSRIPWAAREFGLGKPGQPVRPFVRQPPSKGDNEGKTFTRSKAFAVALFVALDNVSEASEIVDALFEALPADIQKRYKEKRKGAISRQFLDNAGQYGIDGADWKLAAIYDNFDKVDLDKAFRNIIKNQIEDQIIGLKERFRPRNTINALSEQDKEFGKWLNDILDEYIPS